MTALELDLGEPEGAPADAEEYRAVGLAADFGAGSSAPRRMCVAWRAGRALLARALELDVTHVVLGPTPESIPFYRRLGFELRPALRDRCYHLPARTAAP